MVQVNPGASGFYGCHEPTAWESNRRIVGFNRKHCLPHGAERNYRGNCDDDALRPSIFGIYHIRVKGDGTSLAFPANYTVTLIDMSSPESAISVAANEGNLSKFEGDTGVTEYSYTVTRFGDLNFPTTVNWVVSGSGANPADASDFQGRCSRPKASIFNT